MVSTKIVHLLLFLNVYLHLQEVNCVQSEWHPVVNFNGRGSTNFVYKNWINQRLSNQRKDTPENYEHFQQLYPYMQNSDQNPHDSPTEKQKHITETESNKEQIQNVESGSKEENGNMKEDKKSEEKEEKESGKENADHSHKEANKEKNKEGKKENNEGGKPSEGGDAAIGAIPIKDQTLLKAKEIAELLGLKGIGWVTICLLFLLCAPVFIPALLTPLSIIITLIVFAPVFYQRKEKEFEAIGEYFEDIQANVWNGIKKFENFDINDMF